jgi:hypothetical protein
MKCTLSQVLTITTHMLLTEVEDLYKIMGFMLNQTLWTHQLPDAAEICGPALLKQFPQLETVTLPENIQDKQVYDQWLLVAEMIYGNEFDVQPIN